MALEYTFSIIKPDAVRRNLIGQIISYLEAEKLQIVAQKMIIMTREQAEEFYGEHSTRPFFNELVNSITSGPIVVQVLKGENAVAVNRTIMGQTDPAAAAPQTIRKEFGLSIGENSVHGSDSLTSSEREISIFFNKNEIVK